MPANEAVPAEVTLLFTDIEGSTKRWENLPKAMSTALLTHDLIVRSAIEEHSGVVFKTIGDAFCAAFADPLDAVAAAVDAQTWLAAEAWGEVGQVRVRMALHTGTPEHRDRDYFGPPVNRVARLLSTGYGEQVLVSAATAALIRDRLPGEIGFLDLGLHRLKDLLQPERIFQLTGPGLPTDFPPIKTLDRQPHNLPVEPTPFVGREDEVANVRALLEAPATRLVTLTGPGGTGKTRLALQAAADVAEGFPDGAWFVALASVANWNSVVAAISAPLGVRETGHEPLEQTLTDYLRDKRLVLVLDNFEHVAAAAPVVGRILAACSGVRILATSRAALRVYGEQEVAVRPLRLPDLKRLPSIEQLAKFEAVELFVERAAAVQPSFDLTAANARAVAEICVKLEGLPLAIELAAARVRVLPPDRLLERLTKRLDLLTGGAADHHERQQTLRGTIAWSYDLLSAGEQALFRRLAVFAGGASLDTAEEVNAALPGPSVDALDGLDSLLQKSLLRQSDGPDGESRFSMLESIREFGLEQLAASGEEAAVRSAHAHAFIDLAGLAKPHLDDGTEQAAAWLERLEAEHDNLRAALACLDAPESGTEQLRLAGALWSFWSIRGYLTEGQRWLERATENGAEAPPAERARALAGTAAFARDLGNTPKARQLFGDALRLYVQADDQASVARTLANIGLVAMSEGELEEARRYFDEALAHARAINDRRELSRVSNLIGMLSFHEGQHQQAIEAYEESLSLSRQMDDEVYVETALGNLAEVVHATGDLPRASKLYEETQSLARRLGDKVVTAFALFGIGKIAAESGELDRARASLVESLTISHEVGDISAVAGTLEAFAGLAARSGDGLTAGRLFGVAEALRETSDSPLPDAYRADYERDVAAGRNSVDEMFFSAAWSEGRQLSVDEVMSEEYLLVPQIA